jgi:hypothetical protein
MMTQDDLLSMLAEELSASSQAMYRAQAAAMLLDVTLPAECMWICWDLHMWARQHLGQAVPSEVAGMTDPPGGGDPMQRRTFLFLSASLIGAAVDPLTFAPNEPGTVVAMERVLGWYRRQVETAPAFQVWRGLSRHAQSARSLASNATDPDAKVALRAVAAEADARAGFSAAYDHANPSAANDHLRDAVGDAEQARDPALVAWVLATAASTHSISGRPAQAVTQAGRAVEWARQSQSACVLAFAQAEQAMAYGNLRDQASAMELLGLARVTLARRGQGGPEPAYAAGMDMARLDGREALLHLWAGQWSAAELSVLGALKGRPGPDGHRAVLLADLARCTLASEHPEVDRACDLAAQSLAMSARLGSHMRAKRVTSLLEPLAPYQDVPAVRELRAQLAAATPIG